MAPTFWCCCEAFVNYCMESAWQRSWHGPDAQEMSILPHLLSRVCQAHIKNKIRQRSLQKHSFSSGWSQQDKRPKWSVEPENGRMLRSEERQPKPTDFWWPVNSKILLVDIGYLHSTACPSPYSLLASRAKPKVLCHPWAALTVSLWTSGSAIGAHPSQFLKLLNISNVVKVHQEKQTHYPPPSLWNKTLQGLTPLCTLAFLFPHQRSSPSWIWAYHFNRCWIFLYICEQYVIFFRWNFIVYIFLQHVFTLNHVFKAFSVKIHLPVVGSS